MELDSHIILDSEITGLGGEGPTFSSTEENPSAIRKFLQLINVKFFNKVGDVAGSDFPPEVPPQNQSCSKSILTDSREFDEWLEASDNFYIKPGDNSSPAFKLSGLKGYQFYDVCNAKDGVFFTLVKTSKEMLIYNEHEGLSSTDPINYTLINPMGHTLMIISSRQDCGLENKVDFVVKGTYRGYMHQIRKGCSSLWNQSEQLLFRFIFNGSVNAIITGDKKYNESMPIGEIFGSNGKIYRLRIATILPAPLKAMLLGASVVLMHQEQSLLNSNNQCLFQKPSIAFGIFGVIAVMIMIFLVCFR